MTVTVRDRAGNVISDEDLKKKVIDVEEYYLLINMIDKRIREEREWMKNYTQ